MYDVIITPYLKHQNFFCVECFRYKYLDHNLKSQSIIRRKSVNHILIIIWGNNRPMVTRHFISKKNYHIYWSRFFDFEICDRIHKNKT